MTDLAPVFSSVLREHNTPPLTTHHYSIDRLDEFLKEAYNINARIADLTSYLRAIRPSYLSTTPPARQTRHQPGVASQKDGPQRHLTDTERAAIDAEAKAVIRQLSQAVERIAQTEQIRQDTASHVAMKKRAQRGGMGALGRWAAGGVVVPETDEELQVKAQQKMLAAHREAIIWFLQTKLQEAGSLQATMMDIRIQREVEKSKSVLYKAKGGSALQQARSSISADTLAQRDAAYETPEQQLSEEQMQLFAQENHDMLRHYEDTLSQVRNAEKSLIEISELQSTLVSNLQQQNEHIDQLTQDSFLTTENVGKGNKELKRASERPSTARMLFHGTCAFCAFLVVWDLVF
ncbi:hypothetical protein AAFC00_002619 [Neodothiora populina]|uniref:t-SNARE coiled-coil homology domain-containing protein n=1 Tax=Neodothiora populina TaxID=2781224 RepID=A0ABR3P7N0_9PEZI